MNEAMTPSAAAVEVKADLMPCFFGSCDHEDAENGEACERFMLDRIARALDAERAKALEEATEFVWGKSGHSREECDCQMCAIARALRARAAEVRRCVREEPRR